MRKLFFLLLLTAVTTLGARALTVENTAGQLSQLVGDTQITQLTVTGTMDARDFLFITEQLTELTSIDLSGATIVAVNTGKTLYGVVTDYAANEIPRTAFFGAKLTSLSLPASIESIGYAAFAGCYQLTHVTIPESVTMINDYAFAGSALTQIDIPASVVFMGPGAFARCESLQSAHIYSQTVGDFAFLGDTNLRDVHIGKEVTQILKGAFSGCTSLQSVSIAPKSKMSRIDDEAFINSGLKKIDIKSMPLGTIGDWAFAQTQLTNIFLSGSITHLGEGALAHNSLLTTVTLPNVRNTGGGNGNNGRTPGGFSGAPAVNRTIERIYNYTFAGDEQLNAGTMLQEGNAYIGDFAFYNVCQDIDTMRLPSTIVYLGERAMAGMTGMHVLKTDAVDVPELGAEVWEGVNQPSVPLITPSESLALYKVADQWMNFFFKNDFILGDVNGDGQVNISDVTVLISYVLNGSGDIVVEAADLSGDGSVNITDVTALIDLVLNSAKCKSVDEISTMVSTFATTSDELALPAVALRAGEQRYVDVTLNNEENSYTAIQCEVVLPQGVTLTDVQGLDRGKGHDISLARHEAEENVYTLIVTSMGMARFSGNEGNVLRLMLTADDSFAGSNAELQLANVMLVTPKSEIRLASDALSKLNDNTAIEQVTADKKVESVRYINVAGQESDTPFNGMNIVVTTYSDGTTKTVKVVK